MKIELELSEREARALATWLDEGGSLDDDLALDAAHQINAQLPKPGMPEPPLFGVVEAGVKQHDERLFWVRLDGDWWEPHDPKEYARTWDDLLEPELIREGIR